MALLCTNTMIYILNMNANSVKAKQIFRTASHVLVNKAIKDITNGRKKVDLVSRVTGMKYNKQFLSTK